jgi:glycyl-tRNA synthetase
MFIVKKKIGNEDYYYLRENKRIDGKVVSKSVAYLGKNLKEAEKKAKEIKKGKKKDLKNEDVKERNMEKIENKEMTIEDLASFCKRKGFVFRSSDIYGGFSGFWDFGSLGVELFNNIKKEWWNFFVRERENVVGMEGSIIAHPRIWKASGHLESFSDVAVVCKKCKKATKIDKSELGKVKCENCGGEYVSQGEFNLMFKTKVGALDANEAYLRGETAQGMFSDFKLVAESSRQKLPFGIAQLGRCFRNEIAPRDFLFRCREFHIGEVEFFINPEEDKCDLLEKKHKDIKIRFLDAQTQSVGSEKLKETTIGKILKEKRLGEWHAYWLAEQVIWFYSLGLKEIKIREHTKDELSHYSSGTFDIDYEYPFGSKEIAGNADRGQYDLTQHAEASKNKLEIFDEGAKKNVVPRVIEPTFGMERVFLALLSKAYGYDVSGKNIVLSLPAKIAPVKAAVFPIVKKEEFEKMSEEIVRDLRKEWNINYDKSGSIGRRYARNDEIGTPFCITIDGDSLKGRDVTIRDRDSSEQRRVKVKELRETLRGLISGELKFEEVGKKV